MGTAINVMAIFLGAVIGSMIGNRLPKRISKSLMDGTGLYILFLGVSIALGTKQPMILFISLALGAVAGEALDIEGRLNSVGEYIEKHIGRRTGGEECEEFIIEECVKSVEDDGNDPGLSESKDSQKGSRENGPFTKGFVSASLIFCIGPMAVMGAIQEGLTGEYNILATKAMLDGITTLALVPSLGIGAGFSGLSVLIYQGLMTIAASGVKSLLTDPMINEMSAVGGILIMGIGINMLGLKGIKVGNLLPSIFIALIIMAFI